MAIWQFDAHLLPRTRVVEVFESMPSSISLSEIEREDWFGELQLSPDIEQQIKTMLPEIRSWSKDKRIWGEEDGHRIDILYGDDKVVSILVRISAQDQPIQFISKLANLCAEFDLVLVTEANDVLQPDALLIERAFTNSPARAFVG